MGATVQPERPEARDASGVEAGAADDLKPTT